MIAEVSREGADALPLHGRAAALAQLTGALDATERGEGRLVLVVGAAGIGKSSFLAEAVHRAKGRGFRTAEAEIVARDTPVPYDLVRDLILALSHKSVEGAQETKQSGLPLWLAAAKQAGAVSGFPTVGILPEGAAPVEKRILQLLDLEGSLVDLARRLLYAELVEMVRGPTATTPLLLALDDLHHADRESLEFLRTLISDIGGRRLILLAALDPDAPARGPRRSSLEWLRTGPNVESITLTSLSIEDTGKVIRDRSEGTPPPPEYVQAIYLRSKGVPRAVAQWSRRWKNGLPTKDAGEVEGLGDVSFHAEGIPAETRRILTCGAVIGRQFDLAVLARILHRRSVEGIEALLESLVQDGTLRRRGLRRYEFAVPAVRQELYTQLPEARRRLMHRNVARALETAESSTGPELFEIAWHYHLAGERNPSVQYNRQAADVAVRQFAYDDARLCLERALDSLRHPPAPTSENERLVRISLGHVLGRLGRIGEAIEVLAPLGRPHQQTFPGTSPLESLFVPETHPDLWAHALNARAVAERSLRAFRAKSETRWLAMAHRALGVAAWSLADPAAAEEHHRAAAELAHAAGDARLEGQSLLDRAHLVRLLDANGLAVSRRLLTDAIERLSASGDAEWLARAYLDRAVVLRALGRLNEALTDLTKAAEQAERNGAPALQTWVELRTARVLVEEGRTGRARKTIERIRQRSGESPRREVDQQLTFIQAMLQEKEGRLDRARTLYEKSLLLATDAETPGEAADTHRRLADLEGKLGRAEEARRHREEAERLTGTPGRPRTDLPAA